MEAVCDRLEQLVSERILTGYAIGGATAAGFHGEPLATRDIDVFVFLNPVEGRSIISLEPVYRRLEEMGYTEFEDECLLLEGFPVQFLTASPGLETEAVEQAMVREWGSHRIRVMTPEHLAAIALTVGRPKDRARVVYLVELPGFERQRFHSILQRYGLTEVWQRWAGGLGLDA